MGQRGLKWIMLRNDNLFLRAMGNLLSIDWLWLHYYIWPVPSSPPIACCSISSVMMHNDKSYHSPFSQPPSPAPVRPFSTSKELAKIWPLYFIIIKQVCAFIPPSISRAHVSAREMAIITEKNRDINLLLMKTSISGLLLEGRGGWLCHCAAIVNKHPYTRRGDSYMNCLYSRQRQQTHLNIIISKQHSFNWTKLIISLMNKEVNQRWKFDITPQ